MCKKPSFRSLQLLQCEPFVALFLKEVFIFFLLSLSVCSVVISFIHHFPTLSLSSQKSRLDNMLSSSDTDGRLKVSALCSAVIVYKDIFCFIPVSCVGALILQLECFHLRFCALTMSQLVFTSGVCSCTVPLDTAVY